VQPFVKDKNTSDILTALGLLTKQGGIDETTVKEALNRAVANKTSFFTELLGITPGATPENNAELLA